jgi:hypothetical protein
MRGLKQNGTKSYAKVQKHDRSTTRSCRNLTISKGLATDIFKSYSCLANVGSRPLPLPLLLTRIVRSHCCACRRVARAQLSTPLHISALEERWDNLQFGRRGRAGNEKAQMQRQDEASKKQTKTTL